MEGICSTCLSRDRRLTPVNSQVLDQLFSLKLNWVKQDSDICWECRSTLYKCVKFRATAFSAHITLDNFQKCPQMPTDKIRSLSNLKIHHNTIVQSIYPKDFIKTEKEEPSPYSHYEFSDTKHILPLAGDDYDASADDAYAQNESPVDYPDVSNPIEIKLEPKEAAEKAEEPVNDVWHVIRVSLAELHNLRAADRASKAFAAARTKCETCLFTFDTARALTRHVIERHHVTVGDHVCTVCAQRFPNEELLAQHYQRHFDCYVCKKCGCSHTSLEDITVHMRKHHPPSKTSTKRKKILKTTVAAKKEKRKLECTICDIVFTTMKRLSYHNCTVHKPLKRCDKCGKKYANNDSLKKHIQAIHNGGLPKQECPVCHKKYAGQGSLATHMQIQHSQNEGYCAECDRHFKSAYYYRRHIRYNWRHRTDAVMKYECDECGKKFMSKKYVSNHIETVHVRRLNYKCAHCGKEYTSNASLGAHVRKHHSSKPRKMTNPNVCEVCGKSFKLKKCLSEHMNTHTGARPFVCSVCGDAFAYSSVLYTHNRLKHLHLKARGKAPPAPPAPPPDAPQPLHPGAPFCRPFRI